MQIAQRVVDQITHALRLWLGDRPPAPASELSWHHSAQQRGEMCTGLDHPIVLRIVLTVQAILTIDKGHPPVIAFPGEGHPGIR